MEKSSGVEYNREVFLPASQKTPSGAAGVKGILLLLACVAAVAVICFIGYRAFGGQSGGSTGDDTRAFVQVDMQLAQMQDRLDQLEAENRRLEAAQALANSKKTEPVQNNPTPAAPARAVYRVTPSIPQQPRIGAPDPATTQKLSALQQDLGSVQNDASANREAWQATTDRLADVAGQVGSQHGEILRNEDEVNQLLAQTARSALPFELRRGASPQQLGPVSVQLKSSNAKNQRYTVCIYVHNSCTELRDRTLYEVVQVAVSRNSPPLQVIATMVGKDEITGYLEVPREAGTQ